MGCSSSTQTQTEDSNRPAAKPSDTNGLQKCGTANCGQWELRSAESVDAAGSDSEEPNFEKSLVILDASIFGVQLETPLKRPYLQKVVVTPFLKTTPL
ncbi:hypothetical protein UY3_03419 [Chelonia mydas]|uniref:Uncharacterized protein n=1 Tax=Chelonia mydas TaxID=8469 RepID=M7CEV6_CHEMY|nr:hypothetical protein UY3_03419 [Chelonia mydas]